MNERTEEQSAASSLITTLCADLNFHSLELLSYQKKGIFPKRRGIIRLLVILCKVWARPYAVQLYMDLKIDLKLIQMLACHVRMAGEAFRMLFIE